MEDLKNKTGNENPDVAEEKKRLEEDVKSFEPSPWVFFVRKNKLTYLIVAFLLIFGIININRLPRELNPEVEIPVALVVSIYPGASPSDVEEQVTKKIENRISELNGIKRITSTSSSGISSVVVEFEAGEDLDESIRKLKDKTLNSARDLPADVENPEVVEININDQPIMVATITSEDYDLSDLKKFGDNLSDRLKSIPFVSEVRVVGGRSREVSVDIDPEKMSRHNLSVSQVAGALSANNFDFPSGSLELGNLNYSVRLDGQFREATEVAGFQVAQREGKPVYLSDIADVKESLGKETSRSRISLEGNDPSPAVSLQVYKSPGGDITRLVRDARERIDEARGRDYPEDVQVEVTRDFSVFISESIDTLLGNGIQTVFLILFLLFFFLGWREALIAGLSIPFSFFVAFITMSLTGESLNFLSLFSLVLALGLLVDSAVVIVEGMYQKVSTYGLSGYQAAVSTIKEYAAPLLSGMLTTVAAFFPLLFVIGIFGEFLKTIPVVVIATLTAALFVSLTIIPSVGSAVLHPVVSGEIPRRSRWEKFCARWLWFCRSRPRKERLANRVFERFSGKYYRFLPRLISKTRNRATLIIGVWLLLILSFSLPFLGILKIQSFPPTDSEFFFIELKMPSGTSLEKTDRTIEKVEEELKKNPEVINFVSSVGTGLGMGLGSGASGSNTAFIEVNLTKKDSREAPSYEIVSELRKILDGKITEGELSIVENQGGPPTGAAVEVRVQGEDLFVLERISEEVKSKLAEIPTVIDAKTSVQKSPGEIVFVPNREILAFHGLTVSTVGAELRNAINRNDSLEIRREGEEVKINIGVKGENLSGIEGVRDLKIPTPSGRTPSISELGELIFSPALASISHYDKERTVTITSGTDGGNPTEISNRLQEEVSRMDIPRGYAVSFGGEQEELQEVFMDMFMKMIIGIILILFILIIQFNSYRQVAIILFTIPLAMIGVIIGMTLARLTINIPSFIGIVSLAGIVVNNAIILIDEINRQFLRRGDLIRAVSEAGRTRLRPVFLTTLTTVFGLLPLSITQPDWRNMGFTIIFGLIFSTFLTLFVVPTLYVSFNRKKLVVEKPA